jgi:hypothetical protein
MSTTRRTPNLTDRGHGIGQHYYNDSVDIDRRIVPVRQIIVWDVFGENMHRFDLDTLQPTPCPLPLRRSTAMPTPCP